MRSIEDLVHPSQAISHSSLSESGELLRFLPLFKTIKCCHFYLETSTDFTTPKPENIYILFIYTTNDKGFLNVSDDCFMTHNFSAFDTHFKESESRFECCPRRLRGSGQDVKLRNIVMAPCIPSRR